MYVALPAHGAAVPGRVPVVLPLGRLNSREDQSTASELRGAKIVLLLGVFMTSKHKKFKISERDFLLYYKN